MNNNIINPALEKYAELIINKINEVNASDWKKPWFTTSFVGSPQNLSGKKYHNLNKALLYAVCDLKSYKTPVFLTFNQAQQESIQVLKGVKSFPITFYDLYIKNVLTGERISKEFYDGLSPTVQNQYKVLPIQKFYNVFNLDQTNFSEKYPAKWEEIKESFAVKDISIISDVANQYSNQLIDTTLKNQTWVCPIETKQQNGAYYSASEDKITLPTAQQFPDKKEFYYTALHEMAHSTGSTNRLNRTFGSRFGDNKYAREELVAELSSAVAGKDMGLSVLPRKENAQYLKSWLSTLSDDPKYLMSILQDVSKATTMIESTIGLQAAQENNLSPKELLNKEIQSSGSKSLIGDITISDTSKENQQIHNLRILDKSTGKTEPLQSNGINICEQSPENINRILSGGKANIGVGFAQLNKTSIGWALTTVKQSFSTADSSVGI